MGLHFAVLYGSVRSERQGIKYARFLQAQIVARGHDVSFIDALHYRLPLLDKMFKEYPAGAAPAPLPELAAIIRAADGFLIVSGEYNHGIPPAMKNLLDHFLEEWFWRPSAIACYSAGAFGGVRAAMQLRATLAELGMPSIPSLQPMPKVQDQFEEDGTPREGTRPPRVGRFLDEFEWYARALKQARERACPIDSGRPAPGPAYKEGKDMGKAPEGPPPSRLGKGSKPTKERVKAPTANPRLAAQIRRLLGKHWANKYRHGRG